MAAAVLLILMSGGCKARQPVAPQQLRIATGGALGIRDLIGRALAETYNARLPNVTASSFPTLSSAVNIQALERGEAELAFTQADVAYSAFLKGSAERPASHSRIRAMAKIYMATVHAVVMADSGITDVAQLAGRGTIGVTNSGVYAAGRLILRSLGIENQLFPDPMDMSQHLELLRKRRLIAALIVSRYPATPIVELSKSAEVRLLAMAPNMVSRLHAEFPFFRRITIPHLTYVGQDAGVDTIGVDTLLVCSSELSDDLVAELTRLFIESSEELAKINREVAWDTHGALDGPIPFHPGALRYYRERELFR
jgi:hypothetical protein